MIRSGREENLPYSLSRWTDIPAAKWKYMRSVLADGKMEAFDPRTGVPHWWSLDPKETLGLLFWTKVPTNLILDADLLKPYRVKVHVTLTGWQEVEKGAPDLEEGIALLRDTVQVFGKENVYWRMSPVPLLEDAEVVRRFSKIAEAAVDVGLSQVFLAFLQTNDWIQETRGRAERIGLLAELSNVAKDLQLRLCNEDRTLYKVDGLPPNLSAGICAPPEDFGFPGIATSPSEGCGCVLMVDPFTMNESCTLGCSYCYAADRELASKKRNTTRKLPVVL